MSNDLGIAAEIRNVTSVGDWLHTDWLVTATRAGQGDAHCEVWREAGVTASTDGSTAIHKV